MRGRGHGQASTTFTKSSPDITLPGDPGPDLNGSTGPSSPSEYQE